MVKGTLAARRGLGFLLIVALLVGGLAISTIALRGVISATAAAATPEASPIAAGVATIEFGGLVERPGPLAISELQALPSETVAVTFESGGAPEDHTFTGVRLYDALEQVGLAVDPEARNPLLRMSVVITAKDGYQVVLSGGELDPNFGNAPILLAWEQDGQPLNTEGGPLRLVVPGDLRGGRYVYGIVTIEVRGIEEPAAP